MWVKKIPKTFGMANICMTDALKRGFVSIGVGRVGLLVSTKGASETVVLVIALIAALHPRPPGGGVDSDMEGIAAPFSHPHRAGCPGW